jgi:hypothetical protein
MKMDEIERKLADELQAIPKGGGEEYGAYGARYPAERAAHLVRSMVEASRPAFLTSSTARITIEQHKDWLATIPDPIEPAQ